MDSKTLDRLISTRGLVKISDRNGWAAGVTGIALGFRPLYGNVKVGFVDDMGEYTGEYTLVPLSMVEEVPEPAEPVFTVKLWYVTGAFEAPTGAESLCRTVFEEALSNERVIAGELHDAHGTTLEAFGRTA